MQTQMTLEGLTPTLEDYKALEQDDATHPLMQAYNGLGYVVFKRTYARAVPGEDRTEEWHETVARVVQGAQDIGAGLTDDEAARLFDHIWNLRAFPGGRMLWQLGTENIQRYGGDSLVNCWFTKLATLGDFTWLFERLMLGGGVGFSVDNASNFGLVRAGGAELVEGFDADFVVPDNRHGWAQLLYRALKANFIGQHFTYSVDAVRPEGAPIKTFGGKASGPGALVKGIGEIQKVMDARDGQSLRSVDVLDIANIIGAIVVSGNVRRSAQIAQGSSASGPEYLLAKRWDLGDVPNHRAMSNNSVVVNSLDEFKALPDEFWAGYNGGGEAYGLLNVGAARRFGRMGEARPDASVQGFNPCAEIGLADRESCNLAELVLPHFGTYHQFLDAASLLYKVQKAVAALKYIDRASERINHANMRLGLGVTGILEASTQQKGWLDGGYRHLRALDKLWSEKRGWPESVRLTTVKPSGTLSLVAGVLPGGHPGFARFLVRRVRMAHNDPVFAWCKERGYPWEWLRGFDGSEDTRTAVVEFPVELPSTAILAEQRTATDQLEIVKWLQADWADNAVSVSIYYKDEELEGIKKYLASNWMYFKSLSFLRHSEHGYDQAPLEAITVGEYDQRRAALGHEHLDVRGEALDILDSDCATGACPVR